LESAGQLDPKLRGGGSKGKKGTISASLSRVEDPLGYAGRQEKRGGPRNPGEEQLKKTHGGRGEIYDSGGGSPRSQQRAASQSLARWK